MIPHYSDAVVVSLKAVGTICCLWLIGLILGTCPRRSPIVQEYSNRTLALVVINLAVPMAAFVSIMSSSADYKHFLWQLPLSGLIFLCLSYGTGDVFHIFSTCTPSAVAMILVVCSWEATAFALALVTPLCDDRCKNVGGECSPSCRTQLTAMILLFFTPWRMAYPLTKVLYLYELKRRSVVVADLLAGGSSELQKGKQLGQIQNEVHSDRSPKPDLHDSACSMPTSLSDTRELVPTPVSPTRQTAADSSSPKSRRLSSGASSLGSAPFYAPFDSDLADCGTPGIRTISGLSTAAINVNLESNASLLHLLSDVHLQSKYECEVDEKWASYVSAQARKQYAARHTSQSGDDEKPASSSRGDLATNKTQWLRSFRSTLNSRQSTEEEIEKPQSMYSNSALSEVREMHTEEDPTTTCFSRDPEQLASISPSRISSWYTASQADSPVGSGSIGLECVFEEDRHTDEPGELPLDILENLPSDTAKVAAVPTNLTISSYPNENMDSNSDSESTPSSMIVNVGRGFASTTRRMSTTRRLSDIPNVSFVREKGVFCFCIPMKYYIFSYVPMRQQIVYYWQLLRLVFSNTIIATFLGMALMTSRDLKNVLLDPEGSLHWLGTCFVFWSNLVVPIQGIITGSNFYNIIRSFKNELPPEQAIRRMPWVVIWAVVSCRMLLMPVLAVAVSTLLLPLDSKTQYQRDDATYFELSVVMSLISPPGNAMLVLSGFNPGDLHLFVLPCCLIAILIILAPTIMLQMFFKRYMAEG